MVGLGDKKKKYKQVETGGWSKKNNSKISACSCLMFPKHKDLVIRLSELQIKLESRGMGSMLINALNVSHNFTWN